MNVQTPYRIHLHRRIAREIPELRLASVYTHDEPDQGWVKDHVEEINPVYFGKEHALADLGHPRHLARDWAKGAAITRWFEENNVRAVMVGGYNDVTRLRILAWCRRRKVPCLLQADSNIKGDKSTGLRAFLKYQFVHRVVRSVSGMMVCGSLGAAYFVKYGADRSRIFYLPNEPDYALIDRVSPQDVAGALERFGLDPARKRVLTCCRLIPLKRVDTLIDAFKAIAGERPEFDLVIIGDGPLAPQLKERVPPDLRHRVIFTGFLSDQALVSALYKGSHVFALASEYDAWGLVINESIAAGMAQVCSDEVGAAAELVRSGVNGRTFPCGSVPAIIECLRDVTDPAHLDAFRAASRGVLADWQREADPVEGVRKALRSVGIPVVGSKG
jgi:glycosyltransferase involved in cell wall biosynthesis